MLNLFKKDYVFFKKTILFTMIYCIILPIVFVMDGEGKYIFLDFLIPLGGVTGPLTMIMALENSNSTRKVLASLPYSSIQKVGARYLFCISLLVIIDTYLSFLKVVVFKNNSIVAAIQESTIICVSFSVFYALYLFAFYWKGYFLAQYLVVGLILIVCLGPKVIFKNIISNFMINNALSYIFEVLLIIFLFVMSCHFEKKRPLDC